MFSDSSSENSRHGITTGGTTRSTLVDRPGDNLSETIIVVDVETGQRVWHFQAVHRGLWDYDFPTHPDLVDVVVDGRPIKAIAQVSKQGFVYVVDRATGDPIRPLEERPVPQEMNMPGEVLSPTQPFPTKPAPFECQGVTLDDLVDFTPELRAMAVKAVSDFVIGSLFTPPTRPIEGGTQGTLLWPPTAGRRAKPGRRSIPRPAFSTYRPATRQRSSRPTRPTRPSAPPPPTPHGSGQPASRPARRHPARAARPAEPATAQRPLPTQDAHRPQHRPVPLADPTAAVTPTATTRGCAPWQRRNSSTACRKE